MTAATPFFPLTGGLDLVTPAVALKPGRVIAALNYEPTASGYRRLRGFERFDGRAAPSDGAYSVVHFTGGDADGLVVAVGDTINQVSGWTGVVAIAPVVTSGSFAGGNAAGYVVTVGHPGGAFAVEALREGVTTWAMGTSLVANEAVSAATSAAGRLAIATALRNLIAAVPGSGPVTGVWYDGSHILAVRDNAGATAGVFHKSSILGWLPMPVGAMLSFISGSQEILVGDVIEGAISAATATVAHVLLVSGTWAGGDAVGNLTVTSQTGNFTSENINNNTQATLNVATVLDDSITQNPPAGGRYEFIRHNFYGSENLSRTYGVNGVGKAFSYDGTVIVPIYTGMDADTPTHLAEHRGSLFLSFPGGSLQFSAVGEPFLFDAIVGAGEIGVGSDITALVAANKSTLGILAENSINVLYGNDSSDYQLEVLTDEAGALAYSAQRVDQVIYLDNAGLRSLAASARYGNFNFGVLSELISPLLEDKRRDGVNPVVSFINRKKVQYWLIFDDGTGICGFLGRKAPEFLPFDLDFTPTCACSVEIDGVERIFLGASDGYVYEFEKGTSFDGDVIEHYLRMPFNHFGSPNQLKKIHKALIDVEASSTTTLLASFDLDLGAVQGVPAQTLTVTTGGGAIDDLGSNELYFASQIEAVAECYVGAAGKTISMKIGGSTSSEEPHTLTGVTYHVTSRGLRR